MDASTRAKAASLFRGIAWLFFAGAGLAYWIAGGVIHAFFPGTDRVLAEFEGMALVLLCLVLGALAKSAEGRLEMDPDGPESLGEALRK